MQDLESMEVILSCKRSICKCGQCEKTTAVVEYKIDKSNNLTSKRKNIRLTTNNVILTKESITRLTKKKECNIDKRKNIGLTKKTNKKFAYVMQLQSPLDQRFFLPF